MTESTPAPVEMPDEEVTPPPSTEPKQDDKGPSEPVATEEPADTVEAETEQTEDEPVRKAKSGYARKKIENSRLKEEKAALEAEIYALRSRQNEKPLERPKVEQFTDYAQYEEALDKYHDARAEMVSRKTAQEVTAAIEKGKVESEQKERLSNFSERLKEDAAKYGIKSVEDDASILLDEIGPFPPAMRDVLWEADSAAPILHYLKENLEYASELYEMPPAQQVFELGKLEAKLSLPQRKATKAPPPINSPRGGASPPRTPYEIAARSDDISDYVKARKAMKD